MSSVLWPRVPSPLATGAVRLQWHDVCFPVRLPDTCRPLSLPSPPLPSLLASLSAWPGAPRSRLPARAGAIPGADAPGWGPSRLRDPRPGRAPAPRGSRLPLGVN